MKIEMYFRESKTRMGKAVLSTSAWNYGLFLRNEGHIKRYYQDTIILQGCDIFGEKDRELFLSICVCICECVYICMF